MRGSLPCHYNNSRSGRSFVRSFCQNEGDILFVFCWLAKMQLRSRCVLNKSIYRITYIIYTYIYIYIINIPVFICG